MLLPAQTAPDLSSPHDLILADETATVRLAEDIAAILAPGDVVLLSGDLGTGKSTLSRALLRTLADDPELEVPSPTFTLVQAYDLPRFPVAHFDLYRIEEPEELEELGLDEILETGAALIEWPEQAGDLLPANALHLSLREGDDSESRRASFSWDEKGWGPRLGRSFAIRTLIEQAGWQGAERRHLKGDASTRAYEIVRKADRSAVLMNSPALDTDRKYGAELSYSEIVHLAQNVRPFVGVGEELRRHGYAAPEIFAGDLGQGLLFLEKLGSEGVVADGAPIAARYEEATRLLARMHSEAWPRTVPLPDGSDYTLPDYSRRAMLGEVDLFLDWYIPEKTGGDASDELRREYHALWNAALDAISSAETGWVLRDYHSPNLIWREDRAGLDRVGVIDFQDAVVGPVSYDVGSLLSDARVTVPAELEAHLYQVYVTERRAADATFDEDAFAASYAVMTAQRLAKIFGIFVRLERRDHKTGYMRHLPRLATYLDRAMQHPVLSDLKLWYEGVRL